MRCDRRSRTGASISRGPTGRCRRSALSPDQRWLVYVSNETGRSQVYLRRLRGGGRTLVSRGAGEEPVWSRDGRRLYYVEHDEAGSRSMAVRVETGASVRISRPEVVVDQFRYEPIPNHANWDIAPDGRMIIVEPMSGGRLVMLSNWTPSATVP